MPGFERLLDAYELRVRQSADELMAELDPSREERAHLLLVSQLVQSLIRAYDAFQMTRPSALDASTSVMYAEAGQESRGLLNVPLRSLVDSGTLSPAQARFLNGNLGLKRSLFIAGMLNVGKSTLLNALIGLLPSDLRLVVIKEDTEELPALRGRSFVVQIAAPNGTSEREQAIRKAGATRPDWIIVDRLDPADAQLFLETLTLDTGGLATVSLPAEKMALTGWLGLNEEMLDHLIELNPLAIYLERDSTGRPRIDRLVELALKETDLLVTARRKP